MEPSASEHSIWRTFFNKMEQNEGLGRMARIGAELVLTCFLPTELVRSCINIYCNTVVVKKALPLLDLPPEAREVIYNKVTNRDIKRLRQVCRQIQEEIDFMVGVGGILDDDQVGNLEWIQRVKLRSLRVINFQTPITNTFVLAIPKSMKNIHIIPSPLCPSNLKAILQSTTSIRELELHCLCGPEAGPIHTKLLVAKCQVEFSGIILDAIRLNYHLINLSITMLPYSNGLEIENLGCKKEEYHTGQQITGCQDYSRTLKSIRLTAQFISRGSCDQWKLLFDLQTQLECVRCAMGPVHWSLYSKMLQNCCKTLKIIDLTEVQSFNPECPFDWSILSQTPCLEVLHIMVKSPYNEIHGHARFESINFSLVNMANLRELTLAHVSLDESEFEKIFNTAPKLEIIHLFLVRCQMDFYPILSTLRQALKMSSTIQKVYFVDTPELFEQDGSILIWIQEFDNVLMWTKYKYTDCDYKIPTEIGPKVFPGIAIDRWT